MGRRSMIMFKVVCADCVTRTQPFTTMAEAEEWAEWGHACMNKHEVVEVHVAEAQRWSLR